MWCVKVYNANSDTIILLCRPLQPISSFELYEFSNTEKKKKKGPAGQDEVM